MNQNKVDINQFNNKRFSEAKTFHPMAPEPESTTLDAITLSVVSSSVGEAYKISKRIAGEYANYNIAGQRTGAVDISAMDRIEKLNIDLACAVLVDFEGLIEDGKEVEFTEKNKRRLMTEHDWLRNQIVKKADEAAFFYESEQNNS